MNPVQPLSEFWFDRMEQFIERSHKNQDAYQRMVCCNYAAVCRAAMEIALALEWGRDHRV